MLMLPNFTSFGRLQSFHCRYSESWNVILKVITAFWEPERYSGSWN